MKNFKKLLFVVFLTVTAVKISAQDEKRPWAIGVGLNFVDVTQYGITNLGDQIGDYIDLSDQNALPVLSRLYVARYLNNGFTIDFAGAINSIDELPIGEVDDKSYYSTDLGLRYDLNNLFGETEWFDPYAKFSIGTFWVDGDIAGSVAPSLGFNTWLTDEIGLNFETSYKTDALFGDSGLGKTVYIPDYHFQHSISLVLRFGAKDSDKDGILDEDDLCPLVAGESNLFGCPDADGDGVADKDDACPNLAGKVNGCPDADGDGIADKDDACPNLAGKVGNKGCPDSDKDGLADHQDKCPKISGPVANNGCPWPDTDNDGVTDNIDKCINEKGSVEHNGCPVKLTEEAKAVLGKYAKTIQFNTGKSTFKPGVAKTLDKVAEVMNEFEDVNFDVEGHSDSSGDAAKNLTLSQARAQAVVDYLGSHGINSNRLHAVGYGITKPIASNSTAKGRALNRRVVLTAK